MNMHIDIVWYIQKYRYNPIPDIVVVLQNLLHSVSLGMILVLN